MIDSRLRGPALMLPGVQEKVLLDRQVFQIRGRTLAAENWPEPGWAVVKLTLADQARFASLSPAVTAEPERGGAGVTLLRLVGLSDELLGDILTAAWTLAYETEKGPLHQHCGRSRPVCPRRLSESLAPGLVVDRTALIPRTRLRAPPSARCRSASAQLRAVETSSCIAGPKPCSRVPAKPPLRLHTPSRRRAGPQTRFASATLEPLAKRKILAKAEPVGWVVAVVRERLAAGAANAEPATSE